MKKRTLAITLVLALSVLTVAGIAFAQRGMVKAGPGGPGGPACGPCGPGGPGGQGHPGPGLQIGFGPRMTQELGLTEQQVAQIDSIREQFQAATEASRELIRDKMDAVRDLWLAENPDATAIKAAMAEVDALHAEIRNLGVDYKLAALQVLTAEQREQLRTLMAERPAFGPGEGPRADCPAGATGRFGGACPRR